MMGEKKWPAFFSDAVKMHRCPVIRF
jgi:hypothetical protein